MRRRLSLGTLIALTTIALLLPQAAVAQETPEPLLWISYITAEPGQSGQLGMYMAEEGAKIYDGLVADGHVMSWGVAQAVNHYPGDDWTHLEFINFRDWAAVGEFFTRFMGKMNAMSPEEHMEAAAKWDELTVHGSHYDQIGRHQHLATMGGRPAFISLSTFKTKPMAAPSGAKDMYVTWRAPVMDKLMEAGTITAHGIYSRAMHGPEGWEDVTGWYTMPDLGAMDAVRTAFMADNAARTDEQKAEWMAAAQENFEMPGEDNHTDRILVVLHYNAADAPTE